MGHFTLVHHFPQCATSAQSLLLACVKHRDKRRLQEHSEASPTEAEGSLLCQSLGTFIRKAAQIVLRCLAVQVRQ